jgi:hypothetical protein
MEAYLDVQVLPHLREGKSSDPVAILMEGCSVDKELRAICY